ncbi:MAG: hypothetical protein ACD_17C00471G0001 [uncultured bacterium]|nr:MAG: hypothetical protein ACD_17C00471G0001 [uncultured bacterium]
MSPPGLRFCQNKAEFVVPGCYLHFSDGFSSVRKHRHFFAVNGMAPNRDIDEGIARLSVTHCKIEFFHLPC